MPLCQRVRPIALLGPTGGFLIGFLPLVGLNGVRVLEQRSLPTLAVNGLGLILCHACGVVGFKLQTGMDWLPTLMTVSVPFLVKDLISVYGAQWMAVRLGEIRSVRQLLARIQ